MRLRITFAKTPAMRYTGHLDLHHAWERTLRRAGLPLAYSQGFNPHPRINLACALPLGFTSAGELVDIWLERDLPLPEVEAALLRALPPGMQLICIETADPRLPALQTTVEASEYTILLLEPLPDLDARLQALLDTASLPRRRRDKDYDLRPLVFAVQRLPDDEQGRQRFNAQLSARESATGRPEELLAVLGVAPEMARVHRQRLLFNPEAPASAAQSVEPGATTAEPAASAAAPDASAIEPAAAPLEALAPPE